MRYPLPTTYESEYLVPMTITDKTYQDTAAILAEYADKTQDGWMQTLLVLTNSVVHLWEQEASDRVEDALEAAEVHYTAMVSRFRDEIANLDAALGKAHNEIAYLRNNDPHEILVNVARQDDRILTAMEGEPQFRHKIDAIKRLRAITMCGLKPAKEAIEDPRVADAANAF